MNFIRPLFEVLLTEAVALTKGNQRVMNDKNLVASLADSVRDDARSHPSSFPPGSGRSFQKATDDQLAQWFLENIDNIERAGYEDTVYSRDGVNSDWIVRRYIAGSHNWEDITGVMNMNLRDWYLLKNRNMLDPNHKDLPKFNSVRDVGFYMTTHYKDKLEKLRDTAKNAARNKMSKSIKLVDNDDYRIYTTLNRAAGCALGLGTQWCTANSNYDGHFHSYSNKAMLFQLFPYAKSKDANGNIVDVKDEDGKKELSQDQKYQFDASGPNFMNITDTPARAGDIKQQFPFLYTDLATALREKKPQMEKAFAELSNDPTMQADDFKIKTYEIDDEIEKLHKFVDRGYFTDEVRKKSDPADVPQVQEDDEMDITATGGNIGSMGSSAGPSGGGKYPPGTAPTMPESLNYKGSNIMENVDKDVAAMLQSLKKYDKLTESCAPVLMARPKLVNEEDDKKEGNPWRDLAKKDDTKDSKTIKTKSGLKHEKDFDAKDDKKDDKEEMNEGADTEVLAWMKRFAALGNMKGYGR